MRKRQKTESALSVSPPLQTESEHKASLCSDYESYLRAQKTAWEPMSECIESLPANSYGAAVQRIPLEVRRLCDDDDPKAWSRCVDWATDPQDVNPNYVRRSMRRVGPTPSTPRSV